MTLGERCQTQTVLPNAIAGNPDPDIYSVDLNLLGREGSSSARGSQRWLLPALLDTAPYLCLPKGGDFS